MKPGKPKYRTRLSAAPRPAAGRRGAAARAALAAWVVLNCGLAAPALAGPVVQGTLDLTVADVAGSPFGLDASGLLGAHFSAGFEIELLANGGGPVGDGDFDGILRAFDLTIGNTDWSETMPHGTPVVRFEMGMAVGLGITITITDEAHPDFIGNLPASPGTFQAIDEVNGIRNGAIFGTYDMAATVTTPVPVPEPAAAVLFAVGVLGLGILACRPRQGAVAAIRARPGRRGRAG